MPQLKAIYNHNPILCNYHYDLLLFSLSHYLYSLWSYSYSVKVIATFTDNNRPIYSSFLYKYNSLYTKQTNSKVSIINYSSTVTRNYSQNNKASIVTYPNYYPFGMLQPGRNGGENYRYGMNGMEQDNEVAGKGNSYTAPFWQYDSRLGRRWNTDPIVKTHESPYATFANNPVWFVDPSGADTSFSDNNTRQFVLKHINPELNKKGKVKKKQKNYRPEYKEAFDKLVKSDEMFEFNMKSPGEGNFGLVSYDGSKVNIFFSESSNNQAGWSLSGVLFEETFHATQFLDGKLFFMINKPRTKWESWNVDIYDEVEAKKFALHAPGNSYSFSLQGLLFPTQVGYIYNSTSDEAAKKLTTQMTLTRSNPATGLSINFTRPASYPGRPLEHHNNSDFKKDDGSSTFNTKIKNNEIFGYPTK